jgi:hypothetical protein
MKSMKAAWAAAAVLLAMSGTAQAALVLQSNGAEVLDTDTNLLWLYDWNSWDQSKNWDDAKTWAAGLTVGGATAGDWRLPEIGEYADLWADPDIGSSIAGLQGKFSIVFFNSYWSGTEYAPNHDRAWAFFTDVGFPLHHDKGDALHTVAVRQADVAAPVPEPQTLALALLAMGATVVARRSRSR